MYYINRILGNFIMTGLKKSSEVLNNTLSFIIKLLNDNKIDRWFVCYGTLLGLVRENSCIDKDDDVDIIIHKDSYDDLKKILNFNNIPIEYGYCIGSSRNIIKTKNTDKYATIDIYMADFNVEDVYDRWNRLNIANCFLDKEKQTFIEKEWNGQTLYYPNNYERILINRYGNTWNVKQDKKIPQTMKSL